MLVRLLSQGCRFSRAFSSSSPPEPSTVEDSLNWLAEVSRNARPNAKTLKILREKRPWCSAPTIHVRSKVRYGYNKNKEIASGDATSKPRNPASSSFIMIRWPEFPARNLNIILQEGNDLNMYTSDTRAVFYAMAQALAHGVDHTRIVSLNEVVVKVGNGNYKANKQVELFAAIRRRTAPTDERTPLKVKLDVGDEGTYKFESKCDDYMYEQKFREKFAEFFLKLL